MITNFNKSKNSKFNEYVEDYYNRYNKLKDSYYDNSIYKAALYRVPSDFYDEFAILYFYYKYYNKPDINTIKNYIKCIVKNDSLISILNKIKKNPKLYVELENLFIENKKFNNSSSLDYINNSAILYIFYVLKKAIDKTPEYIKDSIKYNL